MAGYDFVFDSCMKKMQNFFCCSTFKNIQVFNAELFLFSVPDPETLLVHEITLFRGHIE